MEGVDKVFAFKAYDEDEIDDDSLFSILSPEIATATKRVTCTTCGRPRPSSCFCAALPNIKLSFMHAYCIILQHPNESKQHQNLTLPFIEHCVDSNSYLKIIGRRFPTLAQIDSECTTTDNDTERKIANTNEANKLVYLHCMNSISQRHSTQIWLLSSNENNGTSITLTQALDEWEQQKRHCDASAKNDYPHIVVIALDATWKYANEMDRANVQHGCYPNHCMRRVRLTSVDFQHLLFQHKVEQTHGNVTAMPQHRSRFSIRTPPKVKVPMDDNTDRKNVVYLSTAECLAYVLARIEQNDTIYHTVMKPLDLMVRQWKSNYRNDSSDM